MAMLLKARQACDAAELCDAKSTSASGKLDELAQLVTEIVEQGADKILVFSEWTQMLKLAAARLDKLGVEHLTLHGGVPTARRPALLDAFRDNPATRVLLSTDAGGVGLNLQVASYVIHLDLPWNPGRLDQRTARAHRLGQTRGVSVTYLCAESGIERGIEGTLAGKRALRGAALDQESEAETLDAPSFTLFLRQLREVMERMQTVGGEDETLVSAIAQTELPPVATSHVLAAPIEATPTAPPAGRSGPEGRLRLATIVLEAGFPGDAVRAAYEGLAGACTRYLLSRPRRATRRSSPPSTASWFRPAALHRRFTARSHGSRISRSSKLTASRWTQRSRAKRSRKRGHG